MDCNNDELMEILFDKNDSTMKDLEKFLDENLENLRSSPSDLQLNDWPLDDNVFWSSFVKDTEIQNQERNNDARLSDSDDRSHFSDSMSPASTSTNNENENCPLLLANYESNYTDLYSSVSINMSSVSTESCVSVSTDSTIDIGADVVVETSEFCHEEDVEVDSDNSYEIPEEIENIEDSYSVEDCPLNTIILEGPQLLKLSEEEKRLMKKEGINIPMHLPLTKAEEKDLKKIRRKIRNKQSAQDSRKRKKEYITGLESRIRLCTTQNVKLEKLAHILKKQNISLVEQIKRLQAMVKNTANKSVQSSTCLMVLMLSFALLLIPNFMPNSLTSKKLMLPSQKPPVTSASRTLLYSSDTYEEQKVENTFHEDNNVSETFNSKNGEWEQYVIPSKDIPVSSFEEISSVPSKSPHPNIEANIGVMGFDSGEPPAKRCRTASGCGNSVVPKLEEMGY